MLPEGELQPFGKQHLYAHYHQNQGERGLEVAELLLPNTSFACSCSLPPLNKSEKQLVELERKNSKAIFVGEVLEIIVPKTASGEPAWVAEVRFKVQRAWKGVTTAEATVFTANVCCVCGYKFNVGESYLVYAYGSGKNGLGTNICTRTKELAEAEKDSKVLGKAKVVGNGRVAYLGRPKHNKALQLTAR